MSKPCNTEYLGQILIQQNQYITSIELPMNVLFDNHHPRTKLDIWEIIQKQDLIDPNPIISKSKYFGLTDIKLSNKCKQYYQKILSFEITNILMNQPKIKSLKLKPNANLLLLDFDQTLATSVFGSSQIVLRPYLKQFLKFACQKFNVVINTMGGCRMGQIGELNTFEGVHILATIGFNDQKDWFNKWIKK